MPDLSEFEQIQAQDTLRTDLDKALRDLNKAKATKAELVDAVYRAARSAASSMTLPALPALKTHKGNASPEAAILMLSDWQLGKRTPSYDSAVCAERVQRYAEKAVRIIELQRAHHPVDEARIYLLGDLLEGEEIFPGQAHRIDASLYKQLFDCAALLAGVVRTVAASVPRVRVVGCIGNHGSLGGLQRRNYHPETNADAMAYNVARMMVADEPRIEWAETLTAGERSWYATDEVMGHKWFMFHGDQIQPTLGFPWYGFGKKLLGWYTSVEPFTHSASGHWHQAATFSMNAITHWGSGSTESGNTYAQEYLASGGQEPTQWLLFMGESGITAEYRVRLGVS